MENEEWGPATSREEWLYMYERGLSPARIAELCRVPVWVVRRVADRRDQKDPESFHRRPVVHDQPSLPKARPLLTWEDRYANLMAFVTSTGRLPYQLGTTWERMCQGFLYKMRRQYDAGLLKAEQVQLLERIDGWYAPPRNPNQWQQRYRAYLAFMRKNGRQPRGNAPKGSEERTLNTWLWAQKAAVRNHSMQAGRAKLLDRNVPNWRPRARARAHD